MVRIAAVGDVHFGPDLSGTLRPYMQEIEDKADLFLIAGDLTRAGHEEEGAALAKELRGFSVPILAVLGNHDYHLDHQDRIAKQLGDAGVVVLEGESTVLMVGDRSVGIAGVKGFGGGFAGACGSDFGEPEMKAFVGHTKSVARRLEDSLRSLQTDLKIALLHYSPIKGTLLGERLEVYPFLGSYLLAEAIDSGGDVDLVLHGHAHSGKEKGLTPGGVNVRNVAQPVIKHAFNLYHLDPAGTGSIDRGPGFTARV